MSTTTTTIQDEKSAAKASHRNDLAPLETVGQLGLIQDKSDAMTPVDALFNVKGSPNRPESVPRRVL